jgi:hypothetical protein
MKCYQSIRHQALEVLNHATYNSCIPHNNEKKYEAWSQTMDRQCVGATASLILRLKCVVCAKLEAPRLCENWPRTPPYDAGNVMPHLYLNHCNPGCDVMHQRSSVLTMNTRSEFRSVLWHYSQTEVCRDHSDLSPRKIRL